MLNKLLALCILITLSSSTAAQHQLAATRSAPSPSDEWPPPLDERVVVTVIEELSSSKVNLAAMNDRGIIVGTIETEDGLAQFRWSRRHGIELLDGFPDGARILDINNRGVIVGEYPVGQYLYAGFMWSSTRGFEDLGVFIPLAINDRGQMAGYCSFDFTGVATAPCVWQDGAHTVIADVEGLAVDINNRGAVTGGMSPTDPDDPASSFYAFTWSQQAGVTFLPRTTAGPDGGSMGRSINDRGVVVGSDANWLEMTIIGAKWTAHGDLTTFPALDQFRMINNQGIAIATSSFGAYAVLPDDEAIRLPGGVTAINARGDILGRNGNEVAIWRIRAPGGASR
jgi:hypothetical protein